MFGGKKVTYEMDNVALRQKLLAEWNDGAGRLSHYPKRSDWSLEVSSNGPTAVLGGGVDIVVSRPFAWRVLNIECYHSWIGELPMIQARNVVRISSGAVLRIGTW
jgi:hypothetical protein